MKSKYIYRWYWLVQFRYDPKPEWKSTCYNGGTKAEANESLNNDSYLADCGDKPRKLIEEKTTYQEVK